MNNPLLVDEKKNWNRALIWLYGSIIVIIYFAFINRYRTSYIDDAWTLSWAWQYWKHGEVFDPVFGYVNGDGGTSLFSRTFVFLYGAVASLLGWSRGVAYLVSTLLTLGSGFLWYKILRKLDYSKAISLGFTGLLLVMEIYYAMGHKVRVDALTFFLMSLSFLLFLRENYFFSGLTALISMENHPFGAMVFMYIFAYLVILWPRMKENPREYAGKAGIFILGCLLGLGYYLLLHWPWLGNFGDMGHRAGGNALIEYYFNKRMSWRHWPELAMILVGLGIFILRKKFKKDKFILPFIGLTLLGSILIHRGNSHYVVFIYPPFILLLVYVFQSLKLRNILLVGFLLFQIPQYGYLYWTQRSYIQRDYLEELQSMVPQEQELFIYGDSNDWFAFQERDFHAYGYFLRGGDRVSLPLDMVVIENQAFRDEGYEARLQAMMGGRYAQETLNQLEYYDGSVIHIRRYRLVP